MNGPGRIILASASPRRSELMALAGLAFVAAPANICEDVLPGEQPAAHVTRLAREKAQAASRTVEGRYFIGADTVVALDGRIMGKPLDEEDAFLMLSALSGKTHEVITGFAVLDREKGECRSESVRTEVTFRTIGEQEIRDYIASGCPMDKAGAYAIQGRAVHFVRSISGSYTNVIGLPMAELYELLQSMQIQ